MKHQHSSDRVTRWDAGEAGCSKLIMGLRQRLQQLATDETLEVTARDPGAPIDLWVWCRMTGNCLVSEAHPVYLIRRNDVATRT